MTAPADLPGPDGAVVPDVAQRQPTDLGEATSLRPASTNVITGQLVARWINELGMLIADERDEQSAHPIMVGRWELLGPFERDRLTSIGYEVLVRLHAAGALVDARTQRLVPLVRDHRGRVLASAVTERPVPGVPSGVCSCGEPTRLGTVHRIGAPCYVAADPAEVSAALSGEPRVSPENPEAPSGIPAAPLTDEQG